MATLATGGIVAGAGCGAANGQALFEGVPSGFTDVGRDQWLGIPLPVWALAAVALVVWDGLRQTPWGRYHEAIGKGRSAASLAGLPMRRQLFGAFVVSAVVAAFAGVVQIARLGSATPGVGESFLLAAFAAAFLGSTMLRPGHVQRAGHRRRHLPHRGGHQRAVARGRSSFIGQMFTGCVLLVVVGLSRLERLADRWSP